MHTQCSVQEAEAHTTTPSAEEVFVWAFQQTASLSATSRI
jgi:hypothetical protein